MKTFALFAAILTLGLTLVAADAEAARRIGGGRSVGIQRQVPAPVRQQAIAPTRNATAPAATGASAQAATPAPKRSWMGPVAGLAAGLGLAALASHFGFGEQMASFMMMALLAMAVVAVIGFFMRKRALAQSPAMAGGGGAYAAQRASVAEPGFSSGNVRSMPSAAPMGVAEGPVTRNIPREFDVAAFVRQAKVNFVRLQAANDAGNLDDIREFTTPEMFAEIKMDFAERNGAAQQTDVVSIDAEVLEVVEEPTRYVVSVRFSGLIREEQDAAAMPIDEIWHLVKPRDGQGGWLLAGIQQTQ